MVVAEGKKGEAYNSRTTRGEVLLRAVAVVAHQVHTHCTGNAKEKQHRAPES